MQRSVLPAFILTPRARSLSSLSAPQMCDPEAEAGEWITRMDVVEDGSKLKLVDQGSPGKCGSECRTIARACSDILGNSDTDLGEAMYRRAVQASGGGVSRGWLEPYLCHTVSKACAAPAPPVPATRAKGPKFEAKTQQEVEMDKLMRTMAGVPGMPGMSMYSRDDLAGMSEGMGEDNDEDDGVQEAMMKNKKPASKSSKKGSTPSSDGIVGAISDTLSDAATQAGQALDGAVEKVANAASNAWSWAEKKFGGGADL